MDDEDAVLDWIYEVADGRGYDYDEQTVRGILNCPSYTQRGAIKVALNKIAKPDY
ncbi:hypothetical protein P9209_22585 [Prescottella defluvii]|nr:hypothetical protein P9209_22585 [Prescottella defluvii]